MLLVCFISVLGKAKKKEEVKECKQSPFFAFPRTEMKQTRSTVVISSVKYLP